MNKKWYRLFFFAPLLAILIITNIYEDPANIFHDDSAAMADAILEGHDVYFGSGNGDERAVKQRIIEGMPKHIGCLTMGPSLSMGIRKANVGTESYYNLSASGLNFYDYLAEFGLLELNGVQVDRIVLCVDSYFFDENMYSSGSRNPDMMQYANYMLDILDGVEHEQPTENKIEQFELKLSQAFSLTYFQSSVALVQNNNSYVLPNKRWGIMDVSTENLAHYLSDASWVYALDYRSKTEEDVLNESASYAIETQFCKGEHISEYSLTTFIKLIKYLKGKNVEIEFYLCPLAPALWDRLQSAQEGNQYYILDELENFALDLADDYDIKVTGSYNPYNIGITNSDFWDARHVRHDKLELYFDFME